MRTPFPDSSEHARDGAGIAIAGQLEYHAQKHRLK
jgi:hypothetical protein